MKIFGSLFLVLICNGYLTFILNSTAALCVRPVLPFKCEKCEGTFKSKDSLYHHKKLVCEVAKSFSCVKCDYRTARKYNLREHLMKVHDVEPSQLANFGADKGIHEEVIVLLCCYIDVAFVFQWFVLSCLSSATNVSAHINTSKP